MLEIFGEWQTFFSKLPKDSPKETISFSSKLQTVLVRFLDNNPLNSTRYSKTWTTLEIFQTSQALGLDDTRKFSDAFRNVFKFYLKLFGRISYNGYTILNRNLDGQCQKF